MLAFSSFKRIAISAVASIVGLFGVNASAATLDFTSLGSGNLGTNVAVLPEATITSGADSLYVGAGGISNSICALDSIGFNCQNDLTIDFTGLVSNLVFSVGGFNSGDFVELSAYDAFNALIGTVNITANGLVDLTSFGLISALFFDDSSTGAGYAYGDFSFDISDAGEIPLPAALPLFLAGLIGFGAASRKRKAA